MHKQYTVNMKAIEVSNKEDKDEDVLLSLPLNLTLPINLISKFRGKWKVYKNGVESVYLSSKPKLDIN